MLHNKPAQGFILPIVLVMSSFISFALATDLQSYIYEVQLAKITQAKYELVNTMEVAVYDAFDNRDTFAEVPLVIDTSLEDKALRVKTEWLNMESVNPIKQLRVTGQWLNYDGEGLPYTWSRTALIIEHEEGLKIMDIVQ